MRVPPQVATSQMILARLEIAERNHQVARHDHLFVICLVHLGKRFLVASKYWIVDILENEIHFL